MHFAQFFLQIMMTNGILKRIGLSTLLLGLLSFTSSATAAGVTVTVTPGAHSTAPQNIQIEWTASAQYVTGTTLVVTTNPAFNAIRDNCTSTETDLNNDGTNDGSITATSTNAATFTLTASTGAVDLTMNLCLQFTFSPTSTNYSISILSSNPVDFGSALFYANGGNQVTVTASVPSSLSFNIRNTGDTADTNTCALGTLDLATTSTCSYRLRIETNAANGFQAQVVANHDFGTGYATMTNVVNDTGSWTAGTETYGLSRLIGATTGGRSTTTGAFDQPVYEDAPVGFTFNVDPSPVPTSTAQNFISYGSAFQTGAAPSTTSTSFVEHAAAISAATVAGLYSQVLTYTVTGSF